MGRKIGKYLKVGDIFEVPLENGRKGYVQFIGRDMTQLNMDVLRVFRSRYDIKDDPSIEEIVSGEVEFYTHITSIKMGEEDGIWKKIGKSEDIGDIKKPLFRTTHDWAVNGIVPSSERWQVWPLGGEWKKITSDFDRLAKADIGIGFRPGDIPARMQTGKYPFQYPSFPGEKEKTAL